MKLASARDGSRDGALHVVNRGLTTMVPATGIAATLQAALDTWNESEPKLRELARRLERKEVRGEAYDATKLLAPLPRVYDWADGSAFLNHVRLVRRSRGSELPPELLTTPLVYQGGGSEMLPPTSEIVSRDAWGPDFESEVGVVLGDTPRGTLAKDAAPYVRLVVLINDVSLRRLIPAELANGFGFFQGKPATTLSPVAVTPDEFGEAWRDGRVHLTLSTWHNAKLVGQTSAGPEMHFSFFQLIEHITKTRNFTAGSLLGSGTVSNADLARGYSCLLEARTVETLEFGKPTTPFLADGDKVEIEMFDATGASVCGRIQQRVRLLPD